MLRTKLTSSDGSSASHSSRAICSSLNAFFSVASRPVVSQILTFAVVTYRGVRRRGVCGSVCRLCAVRRLLELHTSGARTRLREHLPDFHVEALAHPTGARPHCRSAGSAIGTDLNRVHPLRLQTHGDLAILIDLRPRSLTVALHSRLSVSVTLQADFVQ